jgi:hypothetical protein
MPEVYRESKEDNALFFLCSLVEYIARKTKNRRIDVIDSLGGARLRKILDLADIYHSDNIERVAADFIDEACIKQGKFDNVSACRYAVPSFWDIGRVYQRLVLAVAADSGEPVIAALRRVYSSFMSDKIDDYNSSVYYDSPEHQFADFKVGPVTSEQ